MKKILSFAIVLMALSSCKKDKDGFVPTTVKSSGGYLEYKQADGENNTNWYSIKAMDGSTTKGISNNPDYDASVVFAYYHQNDTYGLYSPDNYPVELGQKNWNIRLPVSFRKTNITADQMQQYRDQYKDGFPVNLILDIWKKGINENKSITPVQEGETYAYRTPDGKITGLIQIQNINTFYDYIQFEVWVAQ
ncbi:hypothetical protein [Pseudoflavitalea rhizosphaerae]|uniref:hypothetical protein n=1 Tax=Pseudoflavitalea rhizosphaerae TaxID=1884793 RepID=UPI000F8CFF2D|nr:hypothetical protein [Pseudoflavitalea rhizosphaerae]